jgi:hypothetical protein
MKGSEFGFILSQVVTLEIDLLERFQDRLAAANRTATYMPGMSPTTTAPAKMVLKRHDPKPTLPSDG